MSVQLQIPETVVQAIRLPEGRIVQELLEELADMGKYEFGRLLGERGIPRHYGREELEDDLAYARGE